jgi:hypothetical protein
MTDDPSFGVLSGREWLEHLARQGVTPEKRPTTKLDSTRVPERFRCWIPLAERWDISDDVLRDDCVDHASPQELMELLSFGEAMDFLYDEWLAGPESHSASPTSEYIAFSCLAMAWDLANLRSSKQ